MSGAGPNAETGSMPMDSWFLPYQPHAHPTEWHVILPPEALGDPGDRYPIPRGEDDQERLAPLVARLGEMVGSTTAVEMVRVTVWAGGEPLGSRLTPLYWVMRTIADHPAAATHVTLQGLGDWLT